jgi:hypothetical protein
MPVALGRKNALFAGSDEGAENWAAVASLIETAKLNGVDPQRYLADLLTRLVNRWPQRRIDDSCRGAGPPRPRAERQATTRRASARAY